MKVFLFIAAFILPLSVPAQTRTFSWNSDMCSFSGTYDAKKFSEKQLNETVKLVQSLNPYFSYVPFISTWEDVEKIDLNLLGQKFDKTIADAEALDVVPVPYWQEAKQEKVKELKQVKTFYLSKLRAYKEPSVLLDYKGADSCTLKFARPLVARDDSLLKVWLDVSVASRSRNADPERLRRRYEEQLASPDRVKYAVLEVMAFGWGNCANAFIERDGRDDDGTHLKAFKKLFRRITKEECEEH